MSALGWVNGVGTQIGILGMTPDLLPLFLYPGHVT
jgi:hypothetical protein